MQFQNADFISGFQISNVVNQTNKYSDTVNAQQTKQNATHYAYRKINVTTTEFLLRLHGTNVYSRTRQYVKKQYGQQVKTNTFSTKTDPGFVDFLAASTQKKKHKALV